MKTRSSTVFMPQVISAAICKLLSYRGQYSTCQLQVPDIENRLAGIEVDKRFFSFFRRFESADTVIDVAAKLAQKGDDIALTQSSQGYMVWVYEPDAREISTARDKKDHMELPTYGPAPCFLICDTKHYRPCYIKVPDLPKPLVAVYYARRFYSVYRRGLTADEAFEVATKLVGRGDEVAIAPAKQGYAICVWEPEAIPFKPENN